MESLGQLFESDVIAPEQYLEVFSRRSRNLEPEQELMLEILTDAIECILKYLNEPIPARAKLFGEAHDWLFDQDEREPFSFINVCEILNFDPSYLRRGIMAKMRGKSIAQPAPADKRPERLKEVGAMKMRSNGGQRSRAGA
jgi:hypothetical protein